MTTAAPAPTASYDPAVLAAVDDLDWVSRILVEGFLQGLHRSPLRGFSSEFAEYKQYTQGEDLRFLDWQALARLDKPYIRQFEAETNLRAMIVLDATGSMNYAGEQKDARITKFRYAVMLAAALLRLMVRQNDACGLAVIGAGGLEAYLPPALGQRHFFQGLAILDKVKPTGDGALAPHLMETARQLKRRSHLIFLTDAMEELEHLAEPLKLLRGFRHEMMLWQILDPREAQFDFEFTQIFRDLETGFRLALNPKWVRDSYLKAFHDHQEALRALCLRQGVLHEVLRTDGSPGKALRETLARREARL
jgi:uncharacterized protein (DUF58 family)